MSLLFKFLSNKMGMVVVDSLNVWYTTCSVLSRRLFYNTFRLKLNRMVLIDPGSLER